MADPWVEVVRPIWPEVVEILNDIWTPHFCKDFPGKLTHTLKEDLYATHQALQDWQTNATRFTAEILPEAYLALASACGESSFDVFLDCLRSSSAVGKLLEQELNKMWEGFKKKSAKKPRRPSYSRWRHDIACGLLILFSTLSRGSISNYFEDLSALSLISPSEHEQMKVAVSTDHGPELMYIHRMFHSVVVKLSDAGMGILFAILRATFPLRFQSLERESGVGVHLALKKVKEQMKKARALADLEKISITDKDKWHLRELQRTLLEADASKPQRKVNVVREAAKTAKASVTRIPEMTVRTGLSPAARKSYDSALQGAERKVPHIRALFCGPGRVGKTCLRRSMLGEKFASQVDSTIGIELQKIVCTVVWDKGSRMWVWRAEKDEDEQQRLLAKKVLKDEVRERAEAAAFHEALPTKPEEESTDSMAFGVSDTSHQTSTPSKTTTKRSLPTSSMAKSNEHPVNAESVPKDSPLQSDKSTTSLSAQAPVCEDKPVKPDSRENQDNSEVRVRQSSESEKKTELQEEAALHVKRFLKGIHKLPAKFDNDLDDEMCFVDLWDFAGQDSFAAVQHMLLSELRCVYAVVFDASISLDGPAPSTFSMGGAEHPIEGGSTFTNFDVVESWLNTIHQAVGDTDAPVYVIGCQIDKVPASKRDSQKEYICNYIWENAADKAYKNNIIDIIFVDNTISGTSQQDPGVCFLRQDLIEKMTEQLELPIPLRWLPFTVAVRQLSKKKDMPWLSLNQVSEVAHEVCKADSPDVSLDVMSLLQFHHHLGHVLYYTRNHHLNDRVIIDVEWLLKIVSLLFVPQVVNQQERRYRRHYDLLHEEGVLLESLAQHIWMKHGQRTAKFTQLRDQRNYLFNLMEEFSLLFNTGQVHQTGNSKPSRKFYIPALVRRVEDTQLAKAPSEQSPPIYLFSGTRLLFPQTLFWCLVVRCMKHFQSNEDPVLYRTSARILCHKVFWLVLTYFQHGIKLVVEHEHGLAPLADAGSMIPDKAELNETCHTILFFVEEQLEELQGDALKHVIIQRVAHCECSLNKRPCKKHSAASCKQTECRHFVKLVEGEVPRCPLGLRPGQDVTEVAQCWLFPQRAQPEATLSVSSQGKLLTSEDLSEQGNGKPMVTAVLETPASSPGFDEVMGVFFNDLSDVACAQIFNKIAKEFADRRETIISLLLGQGGNKNLSLKRSTTAAGDSERDLLFHGLGMWIEEVEAPTGKVLYDALVDADCPEGLVKKYKKPLKLPESYVGGADIF